MANLPASSVSPAAFDLDLPIEVLNAIQAHPDRTTWLRQVIIAAAEQDLLGKSVSQSVTVTLKAAEDHQGRNSSQAGFALPKPLPIGSLVRDPQRQLGYVEHYNEVTGRYTVQLNNGRINDYPYRLLTFIEGPEVTRLDT